MTANPSTTPGLFALHHCQQLRWPLPEIFPAYLVAQIRRLLSNQKLKMNLDKDDCIDSIANVLQSTANWRRSLSNRYPDDLRNIRSAILLEKLAVDIAYMTDSQWAELTPYFGGWASESWRNGLSLAARQVGFHNRAKHISFFLKALVENLSSLSVAE